ncbi:hypothetical protein [Cellulophaga omnivescoria]|uniref:hypothetical protein n=1 Tax=Cellulophaga omnivescoria TaxID=1888890 RepID=UPI000985DFCF|nr:hypothetical protein [Cellulophaga omnivescoria]WBU90632.1 hypothetical protein PBN93_06350 [Cellulophaga omnivescoria]WKB82765.1 hypothetical protein QYR09_06940 [Cellulophaga lytica]
MIQLLPLEAGNLDGLFTLILLIMFGPALLFLIIALIMLGQKKKKAAKIFFILTGLYLLISLGICGAMITGY